MLDSILNNFNYAQCNNYEVFFLWKKKRKIESPVWELREYQYKIKNWLDNNSRFPNFITWYRKGLSVRDNAVAHFWMPYVLNLDISNFFWHISRQMVAEALKDKTQDIDYLLDFVTRWWSLPQWAPASPIISNLVFLRIDYTIRKAIGLRFTENFTYTRYVDDISIGFHNKGEAEWIFRLVHKILLDNWFPINQSKTRLFCLNKKVVITGMILNREWVWIGYVKYRRLKKLIYLYLKHGKGFYPHIKWALLYVKWVDYPRYEQLKNYYFLDFCDSSKFQELFWINGNWRRMVKSDRNKFNHVFWYPAKRKRFEKGQSVLERDKDRDSELDYEDDSSGWYWK